MKKYLLSLSTLTLLGVSSIGYATLYVHGRDKDGNLPYGDCLEMACPSDICREDEKFQGECCPISSELPKAGEMCTECGCISGYLCDETTHICQPKPCQVDGKIYNDGALITECTKCNKGQVQKDLGLVLPKNMGAICSTNCGCGNTSLQCSGGYCCPITPSTEGQICDSHCPCASGLNCVSGKCTRNVDSAVPNDPLAGTPNEKKGSKNLGCKRICENSCKKEDSHCGPFSEGPYSWNIPAGANVVVSMTPSLTHGGKEATLPGGGHSCHGGGSIYDESKVFVKFNGTTTQYGTGGKKGKGDFPATYRAYSNSDQKLTVTYDDHTSNGDGAVWTCVSYSY